MANNHDMMDFGTILRNLPKPHPETYRRALDWHLRSTPVLQARLRQAQSMGGFLSELLVEDEPAHNHVLRFLCEAMDADDPDLRVRRARKQEAGRALGMLWEPEFQPASPEYKTFEDFKLRRSPSVQEARSAAEAWASRKGPPILTLSGPPGTGKSHLAKAVYGVVALRSERIFFVSEGQLLEEFHRSVGLQKLDHLMRDLREVPWLILDDLGTQGMRDWALGIYDHLITDRHESAGATRFMVTTNLIAKDIQPRVASRIGDRMKAKVVAIKALDYRGGDPS